MKAAWKITPVPPSHCSHFSSKTMTMMVRVPSHHPKCGGQAFAMSHINKHVLIDFVCWCGSAQAAILEICPGHSRLGHGQGDWNRWRRTTTSFHGIFLTPRVAISLRRRGYRARYSFDLATGCDFLKFEDRAPCGWWRRISHFFLMLSPPCAMYSSMQNLNFSKMNPAVKESRLQHAHCRLDFSTMLAQKQHSQNRYFCHEHPQRATS